MRDLSIALVDFPPRRSDLPQRVDWCKRFFPEAELCVQSTIRRVEPTRSFVFIGMPGTYPLSEGIRLAIEQLSGAPDLVGVIGGALLESAFEQNSPRYCLAPSYIKGRDPRRRVTEFLFKPGFLKFSVLRNGAVSSLASSRVFANSIEFLMFTGLELARRGCVDFSPDSPLALSCPDYSQRFAALLEQSSPLEAMRADMEGTISDLSMENGPRLIERALNDLIRCELGDTDRMLVSRSSSQSMIARTVRDMLPVVALDYDASLFGREGT